jgi:DNA-binding CsgD family transcriptional regulator
MRSKIKKNHAKGIQTRGAIFSTNRKVSGGPVSESSLTADPIRACGRGFTIAKEGKPKKKVLKLSLRQNQIMGLLSQGKTMRKISRHLGLSFSTVKTHMDRSYMKLGVKKRTSAVLAFLNGGYLENLVLPENRPKKSRANLAQTRQILLSLRPAFKLCSLCQCNIAKIISGSTKVKPRLGKTIGT